jgi:hypothetical protein
MLEEVEKDFHERMMAAREAKEKARQEAIKTESKKK